MEQTKTCTKCNICKLLSDFNKDKRGKDGYQHWCRLCQNRKRQEAWANYYANNKNKLIERQKEKQRLRREIVAKLKEKPCADCKQTFPSYVMDFDHQYDKKFLVSCSGNRNWHKVLAEIEKCDVICANCHRTRTHDRGQYYKGKEK